MATFTGPKTSLPAGLFRVDTIPGTAHRYSGGGVTVEQLMMDVSGEQFPSLMREIVLNKVGLNDSTYEQPLPSSLVFLAAAGTDSCENTVPGKWHTYPEMAAAELWTTPTDLAKFAVEIALSKHGKSNLVLSHTMAQEMLKPQIEHKSSSVNRERKGRTSCTKEVL